MQTWSTAWWPQWKPWATPPWWWRLCTTVRWVVFSPDVVLPPPFLDLCDEHWLQHGKRCLLLGIYTEGCTNLLNQVVNIPEELIESHDLTVDYILTPSRVIKTNCQTPKPQGIVWKKVQSMNSLLLFFVFLHYCVIWGLFKKISLYKIKTKRGFFTLMQLICFSSSVDKSMFVSCPNFPRFTFSQGVNCAAFTHLFSVFPHTAL